MELSNTYYTLFHIFGAIQLGYTYMEHRHFVASFSSKSDPLFGSWKYLTFLNIVFQLNFFLFCLVIDIVKMSLKNKALVDQLERIRDFVLATVAFPYTIFVITSFWGIFAVDRELVYPASLDDMIPTYVNHLMHTSIGITAFEVIFKTHRFPSRKSGLKFTVAVGVAYLCWMKFCQQMTGVWAYPMFEVLTGVPLTIFILVLLALMCGIYIAGDLLNSSTNARVSFDMKTD